MQKWVVLLLVAAIWSPPASGSSGVENFPQPGSVETRVAFWTRVYTEIGTDGGFLHDSRNLDIVYGALHFPKGASWRSQKRHIRRAKKHYQAILRRLAKGKRSQLSQAEKRVLALWPDGVSNATLLRASRRVRFQLGQADKFRVGVERASTWEPHIREVISRHQVPAELAALPHVESSYDPRAVSKVGAAGLWQFTRSTGRRFLRVDPVVDERFDPFRSSEAAAKLLRENYDKTGSWPLAITAYNHGINGMRRAMRKLGTRDIGKIVDRYRSRRFGFASQNFYSEFLAALRVEIDAERYFGALTMQTPQEHELVRLDHYYPARALSRAFGADLAALRSLNPALRNPVWNGQKHVPKGFELRIPQSAGRPPASTVLAAVPAEQRFARQRPDLHYRVHRGDTVSKIAKRFGVRERDIVNLNGLRNRHRIRVGQRLRLPQATGHRARVVASAAPKRRIVRRLAADGNYTVQRGDTLIEIARDLGVTTEELVTANGIARPNRLQVGQVLRVASLRPDESDAETTPETVALPGESIAPSVPRPEMPPVSPETAREPVHDAAVPFGPPAPPELAARPGPGPAPVAPGTEVGWARRVPTDDSRYAVAADQTLRVQPEETLGHYAHWLQIPTNRLRRLNGLRYGRPLGMGQRLRLDFSRVSLEQFEAQRIAYHRSLRERFFRDHRVAGTQEHILRRGETLWELSHRRYRIPVWLLSDYNRNVDLAGLKAGARLTIPRVEQRSEVLPSSARI